MTDQPPAEPPVEGQLITITPDMTALVNELKATLEPYYEKMRPEFILAIVSQLVGQLIAVQDPRVLTPTSALAIVSNNVAIGNAECAAVIRAAQGAATQDDPACRLTRGG